MYKKCAFAAYVHAGPYSSYPMEQCYPFHYIKNLRNFTAKVNTKPDFATPKHVWFENARPSQARNFLYPMLRETQF